MSWDDDLSPEAKTYVERPIEKESQEGLRIGKYGSLPAVGETPTFTFTATKTTRATYTGFSFTEHGSLRDSRFEQTYMVDYSWTTVPWYARALGLLRLPYDLVKFIVTGRLILIPWPWRW